MSRSTDRLLEADAVHVRLTPTIDMEFDMEALLVTGGGGFVLSHLARHWAGLSPDNRVIVIDISPPDAPVSGFFRTISGQVEVICGDVSDSIFWAGLKDVIEDPDAITHFVHGAAVSSIERHRKIGGLAAAIPAIEANIMGTAHALAFAENLPMLHRFVNVSSGAVYARETDLALQIPLPEDGYVDPDGLYPVSKYAAELLCKQTARDSGLPVVSARLASVFGSLDRPTSGRALDCIPKQLLMAAKHGHTIKVSGLDSVGDYLAADDVALALTALLQCETTNHSVYNIAAGQLATLSELIAIIGRLEPDFRAEEVVANLADIADTRPASSGRNGAYDISRIMADTGWRPAPLEDAFRDYFVWLQTHDV
jgi:nucleoside-diphosphate-sugar epimerase